MRYAVGAWFWLMGFSVTSGLYSWGLVRHLLVKLGLAPNDGRGVHEVASVWARTIMRLTPGWTVSVEGREHLPPEGQAFVIVANHESMCDILAMYYLGIQFRWLSKDEVFKVPLIGDAMRWAQYVPVKRGDHESQKRSYEESLKRLALGIPMFFFPEGTRSVDGRIKEFKSGAFRLAREMQVPVVPIVIHGAGNMLRKGSGIPGRSHVVIKILPALPPPKEDDLRTYMLTTRQQIIDAYASIK